MMLKKLTTGKITNFKKWRNVAIGLGLYISQGFLIQIGCQSPSIQTATTLVPEKADAIAKVKIAEILNDEDIADL